jgi:hypothetical protein
MTTIICESTECLNHGTKQCTADRIYRSRNGQCDGYITAAGAMKYDKRVSK